MYRGDRLIRFDIIKSRPLWFAVSLAVILAGAGSLATRRLNVGVDFTGGRIIRYRTDVKVRTSDVERVLRRPEFAIIKHNPVQLLAGGREFILRTVDYDADKEEDKAKALAEGIYALRVALAVEFTKLDPDRLALEGIERKLTRADVRKALAGEGIDPSLVEIVKVKELEGEEGEESRYRAVLRLKGELREGKRLKDAARVLFTNFGGHRQFLSEDKVDPVFGRELLRRAAFTLVLAMAGILIYVTLRFEFWYAVAGIIALFHDCMITVGFYSILHLEVNSATVAVILTVFGYSINDTIVIFDRIRENRKKYKREPLDVVMNRSLWETMARSINTMVTTLLPIASIVLFGGASLKDFATGMGIGILSGGYSSIFIAATLVYMFKTGKAAERVAPAAAAPEAPAAPARAAAGEVSPTPGEARVSGTARPAPSAVYGKPGKKKTGKKKGKKSRRR
ncbi:MAG: protein translocase subunit SecF [bacterium]